MTTDTQADTVAGPGPDATSRRSVPSRRERYVTTYAELSRHIQESGLLKRELRVLLVQDHRNCCGVRGIWVASPFWATPGSNSCWPLLAVVLTQFGFLGHDAAHRQIFASHRWNEWAARVMSGLFTGLSYGWWMSKHNRHHANPNKERATRTLIPVRSRSRPPRWSRRGLAARLSRGQGYYFFPLLLLEGLALHVASIQTILRREPLKHRWCEAAFVVARIGGYLTVLFVVLPPGKAAAFLGVQMGLFGLLLGGAFAPNHTGMPIVPADEKMDFLRRQVLMSRNVRGGWLTNFALGGLNYQIEHHLFPSMPRPTCGGRNRSCAHSASGTRSAIRRPA